MSPLLPETVDLLDLWLEQVPDCIYPVSGVRVADGEPVESSCIQADVTDGERCARCRTVALLEGTR